MHGFVGMHAYVSQSSRFDPSLRDVAYCYAPDTVAAAATIAASTAMVGSRSIRGLPSSSASSSSTPSAASSSSSSSSTTATARHLGKSAALQRTVRPPAAQVRTHAFYHAKTTFCTDVSSFTIF
jgi:hypothetical protein